MFSNILAITESAFLAAIVYAAAAIVLPIEFQMGSIVQVLIVGSAFCVVVTIQFAKEQWGNLRFSMLCSATHLLAAYPLSLIRAHHLVDGDALLEAIWFAAMLPLTVAFSLAARAIIRRR